MTAEKPGAVGPTELSDRQLGRISGGPDLQLCGVCGHSNRAPSKPASGFNQYLTVEDYDTD